MFSEMPKKDLKELQYHLKMLKQSPHFQAVINEAYIKDYALHAAHNYANPSLRDAKGMTSPTEIMMSIGCLRQFFTTIENTE